MSNPNDLAFVDDVVSHAKVHPARPAHACADWDYMIICEDCPEYDVCTCPLGPSGG